MKENIYNPKKALKYSKQIFLFLLVAPIIFFAMILFIHDGNYPSSYVLNDAFNYSFLAVCLTFLPLGLIYSRYLLRQILPEHELKSKLAKYHTYLIVRVAAWVGIANYAAVVFLISDNAYAFWIFLATIIGIIINYPRVDNVAQMIKLSQQEIDQIRN